MVLLNIKKLQHILSTSQLRTRINPYSKLALLLSFLMMPMECFAAQQGQGDFYHLYWSEYDQDSIKREGVYVHKNSTPDDLRRLLGFTDSYISVYTEPLGQENSNKNNFLNPGGSDDSSTFEYLIQNNQVDKKPKLISINNLNGQTVYYSEKAETVSIQPNEPLPSQGYRNSNNDEYLHEEKFNSSNIPYSYQNIDHAPSSTSDNKSSNFSKKLSSYAKNRYVQGLLGLSAGGVAVIIFYQAFVKSQKKGNNRKKKRRHNLFD